MAIKIPVVLGGDGHLEQLQPGDQIDEGFGGGAIASKVNFFNKGVTSDKWLTADDHNNSPSNIAPFLMPFDGQLYALTFTNINDNTNIDIEIYADNVLVATWEVRNANRALKTDLFSPAPFPISWTAGQGIGVFAANVGGPAPSNVSCNVYVSFTNNTQQEIVYPTAL